jgi:hypothetical protein
VHVIDRTAAGCTLDDKSDGCADIELLHDGDPTDCVADWGGCNHCGVHAHLSVSAACGADHPPFRRPSVSHFPFAK